MLFFCHIMKDLMATVYILLISAFSRSRSRIDRQKKRTKVDFFHQHYRIVSKAVPIRQQHWIIFI